MPVTPSYRTFVLELLNRAVPPVRARSMFGGVGVYAGSAFFALIADDILYFKTDDTTREEFESLDMSPFQPHPGVSMSYHQVPEHVLEDAETLRLWSERAIDVARRRSTRKPASRRRKR